MKDTVLLFAVLFDFKSRNSQILFKLTMATTLCAKRTRLEQIQMNCCLLKENRTHDIAYANRTYVDAKNIYPHEPYGITFTVVRVLAS